MMNPDASLAGMYNLAQDGYGSLLGSSSPLTVGSTICLPSSVPSPASGSAFPLTHGPFTSGPEIPSQLGSSASALAVRVCYESWASRADSLVGALLPPLLQEAPAPLAPSGGRMASSPSQPSIPALHVSAASLAHSDLFHSSLTPSSLIHSSLTHSTLPPSSLAHSSLAPSSLAPSSLAHSSFDAGSPYNAPIASTGPRASHEKVSHGGKKRSLVQMGASKLLGDLSDTFFDSLLMEAAQFPDLGEQPPSTSEVSARKARVAETVAQTLLAERRRGPTDQGGAAPTTAARQSSVPPGQKVEDMGDSMGIPSSRREAQADAKARGMGSGSSPEPTKPATSAQRATSEACVGAQVLGCQARDGLSSPQRGPSGAPAVTLKKLTKSSSSSSTMDDGCKHGRESQPRVRSAIKGKSMTERQRRDRINDGLNRLRMVLNFHGDIAAMVNNAADLIQQQQRQIDELELLRLEQHLTTSLEPSANPTPTNPHLARALMKICR